MDIGAFTVTFGHLGFHTLINRGNGTFGLDPTNITTTLVDGSMWPADFNGDGIPDLLVTASTSQYIYLGNGDGSFTASPNIRCQFCFLGSAFSTVGDFNQDGKVDFAMTTGVSIAVFLGNGDTTFQDPLVIGIAPIPSFLKYVEMQNTHSGPQFAFVASSSDGLDIDIQTAP